MAADNNTSSGGGTGIGVCTLLTIIFVVLKLLHVIEWSWIWVLCPTWGSIALYILIIVAAFAIKAYIWRDVNKSNENAKSKSLNN